MIYTNASKHAGSERVENGNHDARYPPVERVYYETSPFYSHIRPCACEYKLLSALGFVDKPRELRPSS